MTRRLQWLRPRLARIVVPLLLGARAVAQTSARPSEEVPAAARQVFDGVMSPFCPELLLANCPSPEADSLRRAIVRRAAAGESRAHLEADLLATYGDGIRAAPARHGFGLVAWVTPGLVLVVAAALVRRWARRAVPLTGGDAGARPYGAPAVLHATDHAALRGPGADADATAAERVALDALLRRDG